MNTPRIVTPLAYFALTGRERAEFEAMDKLDDKSPRHMTFAEVGEMEWKRAGRPVGRKAEAWAKKFWQPFEKFRATTPQPLWAKDPKDARDGIVS